MGVQEGATALQSRTIIRVVWVVLGTSIVGNSYSSMVMRVASVGVRSVFEQRRRIVHMGAMDMESGRTGQDTHGGKDSQHPIHDTAS